MTRYGDVAASAMRWVASTAAPLGNGARWPENDELFDDLYSGTAGVLLACAETAAYGIGRPELAEAAVARLADLVSTPGPTAAAGLFEGQQGWLVALRAWSSATEDEVAVAPAGRLLSELVAAVLHGPEGERYLDVISGEAGTLMALLPEDPDVTTDALEVLADRLAGAAVATDVGPQWRAWVGDEPRFMPGLSHGTAGVALALALAGDRLGRRDLTALAADGGRSLIALAASPEGWALPNRFPLRDDGPTYSFGWCHGPTGTVRLFLTLQQLDPQPEWAAAVEACFDALRRSGLPRRIHPGFWDNHARCCGSAGVGQLLLDRYAATGDMSWRDWSAALADDVLSYAIVDDQGTRWSNTEWTAHQPDLPPTPGFMQGAAGIAGWLARLDAAMSGRGTDPPWRVGAGTLV